MTTTINTIAGWDQARQALISANDFITEFRDEQPLSQDPDSPRQQAQRALERLNDLTLDLYAAELQEIDDEIAASGIVDEINELAKEAKNEADALKNAADKIKAFADLIGKIAGVVTKIAGLF